MPLQRPDYLASEPTVCDHCGKRLRTPAARTGPDPEPFDAGQFLLQADAPTPKAVANTAPSLRFGCPHCQAIIKGDTAKAGLRVNCPKCGLPCEVPLPKGRLLDERLPSSEEVPVLQSPSPLPLSPVRARREEALHDKQEALDSVNAPAIVLMIYGCAYILLAVGASYVAYELWYESTHDAAMRPIRVAAQTSVLSGAVGIAIGSVIVVGALAMKRLRSYWMAMAAAVLTLVPCLALCSCGLAISVVDGPSTPHREAIAIGGFLLSLVSAPFGSWALIVLNKGKVKTAFASSS